MIVHCLAMLQTHEAQDIKEDTFMNKLMDFNLILYRITQFLFTLITL